MNRIFIDEVGNHDMGSSDDPNHRYLGLSGVIMSLEYESNEFKQALDGLKLNIFGTREIVIHRREILRAEAPFDRLVDPAVRARFDEQLLGLVARAQYRVVTVVIDKREHKERYLVWRFHPYHYCLTVLLERYVQYLARINGIGDVLVESRGRRENIQLERAFGYIHDRGTARVAARVFQERLSSAQLKIKPKSANIAGLQLADVVVNPSSRNLICERTGERMTAAFGAQIEEILRGEKYLRRGDGLISGWGTKWLP